MTAHGAPAGAVDAPAGREIVFADLFNVRDLGGHRTVDGRVIRPGRWFRGASIHRVAGEDLATLRSLGIRTAIDLRTEQELRHHGVLPTASTGIRVRHLPLIPRPWARRDDVDTAEAATAYLRDRFVDMLDTAGPSVAAGIEILGDPDQGPVIAYCMAGKDRTGVFTALVMSALGVADEVIAEDFHRSNVSARGLFRWTDGPSNGGSGMTHQSSHVAGAPPRAILGFLAATRDRHDSVAGWLAGHGVDDDALERLRESLLVAPASSG